MNKDGVAILKPGQYRGSHKLGLHQGKYEALRQKSPVKVYRDNNKDGDYDLIEENVQEGIFGINIHKQVQELKVQHRLISGLDVKYSQKNLILTSLWIFVEK